MNIKFLDYFPNVDESCFIADTAKIIGRAAIKKDVNIWYNAVIRADDNYIEIGANTNIQDNCVLHVDPKFPTILGENCTVGHGAIVHACTIGNNVLVGMGAIVLDGAVVEDNVIIGAGALIPTGKIIPKNSLVVGSPGRVVRKLTEEELETIQKLSKHYVNKSKKYKDK